MRERAQAAKVENMAGVEFTPIMVEGIQKWGSRKGRTRKPGRVKLLSRKKKTEGRTGSNDIQ